MKVFKIAGFSCELNLVADDNDFYSCEYKVRGTDGGHKRIKATSRPEGIKPNMTIPSIKSLWYKMYASILETAITSLQEKQTAKPSKKVEVEKPFSTKKPDNIKPFTKGINLYLGKDVIIDKVGDEIALIGQTFKLIKFLKAAGFNYVKTDADDQRFNALELPENCKGVNFANRAHLKALDVKFIKFERADDGTLKQILVNY